MKSHILQFLIVLFDIVYLKTAEINKTCADLNTTSCQLILKANPNLCNDDCFADLCKETCHTCDLLCYQCSDVMSPDLCTNKIRCDTRNQLCIATQRFDVNLNTFYSLGCAEKELCTHVFGYNTSDDELRTDKQRRNYQLNGWCCGTDECNILDLENSTSITLNVSYLSKDVGHSPLNTPLESANGTNDTCSPDDVDHSACMLLKATNPALCQHQCVAERICPMTCGTCLKCYECDEHIDPESCQNITTCKLHEKCVTIKTLNADLSTVYNMGCIKSQICDMFFSGADHNSTTLQNRKRELGGIQVQGQCCSTNVCNKPGLIKSTSTFNPPVIGK